MKPHVFFLVLSAGRPTERRARRFKMKILALSVAGVPHRWMDIDRAAYYVATGKVAWALGDVAVILHGGEQRISGLRSELILPPVIALAKSEAMVRHAQAIPLGRDDNSLLGKRDLMICAYCGERIMSGDLTRDHVHPRARGGKDIWSNVVAAHRSCNMRKGCRTPEEARTPLLYVPYQPCRFEHFILSGRHIVADQMAYLSTRLPAHSRAAPV
jgi:5-methylcytosine-specific restriction endonuclease McrA